MALIDSKASFAARVKELGLGDFLGKLVDLGADTYAGFAFMANCTPGQSDDKPFQEGIIKPILGEGHVAKRTQLRRLFFESFTLVSADLKNKLEATDDDKPKKMTVAERNARREATIPKTSGLDTQGVHNPAHSTIDLASQILQNDIVTHLPFEKCPSREMERKGDKSHERSFKSKKGDDSVSNPMSGDLDLQNTLIRRGLAVDMGGLFSYKNHEKLQLKYMRAKAATPPSGYKRVTFEQIRKADERFWDALAELTPDGIKGITPAGTVINAIFQEALNDETFKMLLVPLPLAARRDRSRSPKGEYRGGKGGKKDKTKGKGKGKDKGQRKGKSGEYNQRNTALPRELLPHGVPENDDMEQLCFGYNTRRGCQHAGEGERCHHGLHVCCFKGCYGTHPYHRCPKHRRNQRQAAAEEDA